MKLTRGTWAFIAGAVSLGIYIFTLAPTVTMIDSGELALACAEPGIAHPTGYPLYTVLGRVVNLLSNLEPVLASNLFSAIAASVAVAALFLICTILINTSYQKPNRTATNIVALATALTFGFTATMWSSAVETEVYALEIAADLIALYFLLRWWFGGTSRWLFGSAYIFGLAFGVHMLTLLFAPAALFILIDSRKRLDIKKMLCTAGLFALGLSVYFYLPIRASQSPLANFGDPSSWDSFLRHISGWQYRVWMFRRPWSEISDALSNLLHQFVKDFSIAGGVLICAGLIISIINKSKIVIVLALIIVADVLYSLNYSIPDIGPYYLPGIMALTIFIALGFGKIISAKAWCAPIVLIFPVALAAFSFSSIDKSDYYLVEETATNVLVSAPKNSVVFLNNWDWFAPAVYLQRARGYRPDLALLDYELMRRSWYVDQAAERLPQLANAKIAIADFRSSVLLFEAGDAIDAAVLERKWRAMHSAIISTNLRSGNAVCGTPYSGEMAGMWASLPLRQVGILVEIADSTAPIRIAPPDLFELTEFGKRLPEQISREATMTGFYKLSWSNYTAFYYKNGDLDGAAEYLGFLIRFYPDDFRFQQNLAVIRIEQERYEDALTIFKNIESSLPPGSQPELIYIDLERRIAARDSIQNVENGYD